MEFLCVACSELFESEFVPALDLKTGGPVCPSCDSYRKAWPSRLVFPECRMAQVPNEENW